MLGATKDISSFVQAIEEGHAAGKDYLTVKKEWKAAAGLMTFDDAVKAIATPEMYQKYTESIAEQIVPLHKRRALAKTVLGEEVQFDWELPRTPLGQYMWQWSTKAVIDRAILVAPLGDVTWSRQDKPSELQAIQPPVQHQLTSPTRQERYARLSHKRPKSIP